MASTFNLLKFRWVSDQFKKDSVFLLFSLRRQRINKFVVIIQNENKTKQIDISKVKSKKIGENADNQ